MNNPVLNVNHISMKLGGSDVIQNASFSVSAGSFLGIIGPNGAGKTTLLKILAGLLKPATGLVEMNGNTMNAIAPGDIARMVGYVPQSVDLDFPFTVYEVVKMGRYAHSHGVFSVDKAGPDIISSAMDWMDLRDLKSRPFTQLSGGEKQRVIIASALAQEPFLLLLDEPTSALDLKHQQSIYRTLKQLADSAGKTVIIVTHDINLASQFCSRLIMIHKGRIIKDGTPDEVLKFPVIQEVYGVKVYIDINPFTESIYILPYDTQ